MRVLLLITAALVGVTLVVQIAYARAYAANATRSTKVVWGLNIALLGVVMLGLAYYAFTSEVG